MKRIIAAIDALQFSATQLEGFNYMKQQAEGELTVLFLENISGYPAGYIDPVQLLPMSAEQEELTAEKLEELKKICSQHNINLHLQETRGWPLDEVVAESRFADLLLVPHDLSFGILDSTNPPSFVKDTLAYAQCPVMVLPEETNRVKEVIFSYNGSYSSMYAIRSFTQLFPEYWDMPVQVIYADENDEGYIPNLASLKAYLDLQYDDVTYTITKGTPASVFLSALSRRNDCVATFGAYGRNPLSRFFHRSDADSILRTLNIPLFITHP